MGHTFSLPVGRTHAHERTLVEPDGRIFTLAFPGACRGKNGFWYLHPTGISPLKGASLVVKDV